MKEQIKKALRDANDDNTWITNVRSYREIEDMIEWADKRIEQLEKALERIANFGGVEYSESYYRMQEIARQALGKE